MNRRELVKNMAVLNLGGTFLAQTKLFASAKHIGKASAGADLFKELGVTPIINASVTMTFLSGSLMRPSVLEAINSTSHSFANMYELQDKAGAKIAEMLHCEGAMVTSGAACALLLGAAACVTGTDQTKIKSLPFLPGAQPEVIIQKSHRYVFDQAITTTGVKMVEVESVEEMHQRINKNTVMCHYYNAADKTSKTISHEDFVQAAHRHNIPAFIDAAADVPPKSNLFRFQKIGFDLITFSGGKMIRGPQSAGLLFGRKDLIEAAKLNHSPHESPIGRPMKVNKEEIFGMYAALKDFLAIDEEKELQMWLQRCNHISGTIKPLDTIHAEVYTSPGPANAFPNLNVTWDSNKIKISAKEVVNALQTGTPKIVTTFTNDVLHVGVVLLKDEDVDVVAQALYKVLKSNMM